MFCFWLSNALNQWIPPILRVRGCVVLPSTTSRPLHLAPTLLPIKGAKPTLCSVRASLASFASLWCVFVFLGTPHFPWLSPHLSFVSFDMPLPLSPLSSFVMLFCSLMKAKCYGTMENFQAERVYHPPLLCVLDFFAFLRAFCSRAVSPHIPLWSTTF